MSLTIVAWHTGTPAHTSTHRPALQGLLVVSCLCGLPQQLMVSRTAAHGEPQQLGETEAQRRQQQVWGLSAMGPGSLALASPSFPCIQLCWAGVAAYQLCTASSTRDNLADLNCSRLPEMDPPGLELPLSHSSSVLGFISILFCMCGAGYRTQNLGQAR